MAKAQLSCKHPVMKGIQWIEWIGLFIITIAVMVAIYQELLIMIDQRKVMLHDILLLFIYLEVLSMVALYLTSGKLPVRYPIYIAIVAIARYIILDLKELQALDVIWLAVSMLVLTFAALVLRYGHARFPYEEKTD
jgi:protein PsiE